MEAIIKTLDDTDSLVYKGITIQSGTFEGGTAT